MPRLQQNISARLAKNRKRGENRYQTTHAGDCIARTVPTVPHCNYCGAVPCAAATAWFCRINHSTLTVAASGKNETNKNAGIYENLSTIYPTANVTAVPAIPAPNPLNPVTVPTTRWSNKYDGNVSPIVDHAA